ncbi:PAAR domain-containing protein [Chromobacterium sp. S0633]|uniref:PAAR domain-containing protein n=1 Tax=Chromobacterium sp. S0633 TaxID=2957805 RepID=UPI0020A081D3|nr:PAAR domain-containing protein [Chromobacterium sp. S0633]MCP1292301.1 PAAR domain-containing protein [Chromobacterium sp. S0633]
MSRVIRQGDRLSSGGTVLQGSGLGGHLQQPLARKGDPVFCPLKDHGHNRIAEGAAHWLLDGRPVALEGHRCECGCTLLSSSDGIEVH